MFHVIIPARYQSKRFPGKLLQPLLGMPLLQHTYEHACKSGAASVSIATDDDRIAAAAKSFAATVVMTSVEHVCGTTRIAEAAQMLGFSDDTVVVNLQGDEPLMAAENIAQVAKLLQQTQADMASLYQRIDKVEEIFNPDCVKVVFDQYGCANYFSRAPIPWDRELFKQSPVEHAKISGQDYYRHLGIYAHSVALTKHYSEWPSSAAEDLERLEQLRVLAHGGNIYVAEAEVPIPAGVDNPDDLAQLAKFLT